MSLAARLTKKVDSLLTKYATPDMTVYKRTVTRTGGDSLTGRPGSVTTADVLLTPQPLYARGMRRQVGGTDATDVLSASNASLIAQSYEIIVSANAMSLADIKNPDILLVFVDASGAQEVYRIEDYEPVGVSSTVVSWLLYASSASR